MTAAQSDRRGRQWVTFVHLQFVFHSNEKTNGNVPFVLSNEKTNGKWNKVFLSFYSVCSLSENKETLFPLSIYAYLNKYRRCCILRKVRPLQIVTTSTFTELFSSLFLIEANLCCFFFKKQTKVNSFETHWKHASCIWGMNELLVQTRHKPARFLLFGGFLDKNCLKFSHLRRSWVSVGATGLLNALVLAQSFSENVKLSVATLNQTWISFSFFFC